MFPKDDKIATNNENSLNDKNITEALGQYGSVAVLNADFSNNTKLSEEEHYSKVKKIIIYKVKLKLSFINLYFFGKSL